MKTLITSFVAGVFVGIICALLGFSPIFGVFAAVIVGACDGNESEIEKAMREAGV